MFDNALSNSNFKIQDNITIPLMKEWLIKISNCWQCIFIYNIKIQDNITNYTLSVNKTGEINMKKAQISITWPK